tara:strand:- start:343 stop:606 length:264 start_codon:yes stop_codon:yes gene_type:complete
MKERNIYLKRKKRDPVKINIRNKKGVIAKMQFNGGGPDMNFADYGCMYIEYAGHTIYIDAGLFQATGEFIVEKWKGRSGRWKGSEYD